VRLIDFAKNRDGNFAITFSVILTLVLAAVGAGIDVANGVSVRSDLQLALDSAVLAAAAKGGTLDQKFAENFFASNAQSMTVNPDELAETNGWINVHTLTFSTDSSGNIVGTARATMQTTLMSIAGFSDLDISVTSKAAANTETKIEKATFKIKNAQGAYDKDIYFFTRDAKGKILSETLVLQYDYAAPHKYFKPAKTSDITVNVGDYTSYGYKMVVYEDLTYTGKHVSPKPHYSDDADGASWQKITGKCTDSAGSTNNWEDGGDSNYLDFAFTVKCTEGVAKTTNVRLLP
jgi:Flp pilus assembly protein TadG